MLNTEISRLNAQLEKEKNVLSAIQVSNSKIKIMSFESYSWVILELKPTKKGRKRRNLREADGNSTCSSNNRGQCARK
jgi:hypothetical protein